MTMNGYNVVVKSSENISLTKYADKKRTWEKE
jgi:hypothetical protein